MAGIGQSRNGLQRVAGRRLNEQVLGGEQSLGDLQRQYRGVTGPPPPDPSQAPAAPATPVPVSAVAPDAPTLGQQQAGYNAFQATGGDAGAAQRALVAPTTPDVNDVFSRFLNSGGTVAQAQNLYQQAQRPLEQSTLARSQFANQDQFRNALRLLMAARNGG